MATCAGLDAVCCCGWALATKPIRWEDVTHCRGCHADEERVLSDPDVWLRLWTADAARVVEGTPGGGLP